MESAASPGLPGDGLTCIHFVFLHHGYHGRARDFYYLRDIAEDALRSARDEDANTTSPALPHFVFVHPHGSDQLRTEEGVLVCARRYIDHACTTIEKTLAPFRDPTRNVNDKDNDDSCSATGSTAAPSPQVEVHFSAVAHSMGGLILRAAFPQIMANVEQLVSQLPSVHGIHWDTFCSMAVPHLGVHYMRSPIMTFLGGQVGHRISPAIADLFSKNSLLTHDLVTDESLAAWARFKRRVVISVVNDGTVLVYSSSFVIPVSVRQRIGAALPPPPPPPATAHAEAPAVPISEGEPSNSAVAEAVRGPSHDKAQPDPQQTSWVDVPNADASVVHLAQHGIHVASSVDGMRRNAYELKELTEALWPSAVLPEPRALAQRILDGVGPLELHMVDFRPLRDAPPACLPAHVAEARAALSAYGRTMTHLGAHRFSHAAMTCKSPFYYPAFFGFVSEYVVSDLLGVPLTINGLTNRTKDATHFSA